MRQLPKGVRIYPRNGANYVQVRIFHNGQAYHKDFGRDSTDARNAAEIHVAEKRKEILMGKLGIVPELPIKTFAEAVDLFLTIWGKELDANGQLKHDERTCHELKNRIGCSLLPYFGKSKFHEIRPIDVENWRNRRTQQVAGTTANREQNILSSVFSHIGSWIEKEKIRAFKSPDKNPCIGADKAPLKTDDRIFSDYELSKLKLAAKELNDLNGHDNLCLILKTALSFSDLKPLKLGDSIHLIRSKTGVKVRTPLIVLHQPDWSNWRKRLEAIAAKAGVPDISMRRLRKTAINLPVGHFDMKTVGLFAGHANEKTTETNYVLALEAKMAPIAKWQSDKVDSL